MNGKTAKRLRKEAGNLAKVPKGTSYSVESGTERKVPIFSNSELDIQGNRKVIGVVKTATIVMDKCKRSVYKTFKKVYSTTKGKSLVDSLDAHMHREYVGALTLVKVLNRA